MPNQRERALKQAMCMLIVHGRRTKNGLLEPDRTAYIELSKILREQIVENGEEWPAAHYFPCPDGGKICDVDIEEQQILTY